MVLIICISSSYFRYLIFIEVGSNALFVHFKGISENDLDQFYLLFLMLKKKRKQNSEEVKLNQNFTFSIQNFANFIPVLFLH